MNNLEHEKECLRSSNSFRNFLEIKENEVDEITSEKIANAINGDCTICLCYGCRSFTRNYVGSKYVFDKKQCYNFKSLFLGYKDSHWVHKTLYLLPKILLLVNLSHEYNIFFLYKIISKDGNHYLLLFFFYTKNIDINLYLD